jgi:hypothetical protein
LQEITSREYKMMLQAAKFVGDDGQLSKTAGSLWRDLASIILPSVLAISGTDDVDRKRRKVCFLDTADRQLRGRDYVVRERVDLDDGEREVTLKFRHPDRYISQDRDMEPAKDFSEDMKFEEDIKPRFQAVYSFSSSVLLKPDNKLETLEDVHGLFPGLAKAVEDIPESAPLAIVGDFVGYERVIKGTTFQIGEDPDVFAECSLTLWYAEEEGEEPLVAEFSFKYDDKKEDYTAAQARRAYDAFLAIQDKLGDWIDSESMTKTAYVYAQATG